MNNRINLAYLYPDILNLHGDRGNILAFERIGKMMGLDVEMIRIDSPDEQLHFNNYDIVLLSPGELKVMPTVINALSKYTDSINKFLSEGKYIFAMGTTGAAFAKKITRLSGKEENGLGLLDMNIKETPTVYGDDLYFSAKINNEKIDIMSCQINVIQADLTDGTEPFGVTKYGYGNNKSGDEGARAGNLIYTNALGPVFIKNPWMTKLVLADIAQKKGLTYNTDKLHFELEQNSMESIKNFIQKKPPIDL